MSSVYILELFVLVRCDKIDDTKQISHSVSGKGW